MWRGIPLCGVVAAWGAIAACGDDASPAPLELTLVAAPAPVAASATATFEFTLSRQAQARCRLDDDAPVACSSPWTIAALADGRHVAVIDARSADDELVALPAVVWTIDTLAPDTVLRLGPAAVDNSVRPRIEFGADDPAATFTCALDGGGAAACSSPWLLGPLTDGDHVATITAIDAAGNVDPTPLTLTWTVDTSTPDTVIDAAPTGTTGPVTSTVEFSAPGVGPGATFECFADGVSLGACASPYPVTFTTDGLRVFQVAVTNAAGTTDPSPATRVWRIDAIAPAVEITAGPDGVVEVPAPTFEFTVGADAASVTCAVDDATPVACTSPWTPPPLANGPRTFTVAAADAYGNLATATRAFTVRVIAWRPAGALRPAPRAAASAAYDAAHGELVLFGGLGDAGNLGDTWLWDGAAWRQATPATAPAPRAYAAAAYDAARARVVLYAGSNDLGVLGDTWEWDGTTWTELTPAMGPGKRAYHALAFHAGTGETLLFGGNGASVLGDTWAWNGTTWTKRTQATPTPAPRYFSALAHDPSRDRTVLFGGYGSGGAKSDTWEWDGAAWTQVAPTTPPASSYLHEMAYDARLGVIVRLDGFGASGVTLGWDGVDWTPVGVLAEAEPAYFASLVFDPDRQELVRLGGNAAISGALLDAAWRLGADDTWRSDGGPPPGVGAGLSFDASRGESVLFGGYHAWTGTTSGGTYVWDGTAWTAAAPATSPSARSGHAQAYDAGSEQVVVFGGYDEFFELLADTWTWDGTTWTELAPTTAPPARAGAAAAYDPVRARLVVFGGTDAGGNPLGDTWEWDGVDWVDVTPATSPEARAEAAAAFDGTGIVVFGGNVDGDMRGDTWRWDGTTWTDVTPATGPLPRYQAAMTYDVDGDRAILFGGYEGAFVGYLDDTWAWDGAAWTQLAPVTVPSARAGAAMTYDETTLAPLSFGGEGWSGPMSDLWTLGAYVP
ncbi:MAG: hypothetical protein R2939_15650 [Kofleriaceae bacterium]